METTLAPVGAAASDLPEGISAEEFDRIVLTHQRRVYRILFVLVRDADAADTLTQECFLRAYAKRTGFRGESSVGTWLARIAVNLARDYRKNRRVTFWRWIRRGSSSEAQAACQVADSHSSPERALIAREQLESVRSSLRELSPQQQTAFLLRFVEEMSLEEIAQAMNIKAGTVKSHLSRAVSLVQGRFKRQGRKWQDI